MQRRLYVSLDERYADALYKLAILERRHPSDQAAVMLEQQLAALSRHAALREVEVPDARAN
jgi:hypothetical protein